MADHTPYAFSTDAGAPHARFITGKAPEAVYSAIPTDSRHGFHVLLGLESRTELYNKQSSLFFSGSMFDDLCVIAIELLITT